jgi:hypothetical protein
MSELNGGGGGGCDRQTRSGWSQLKWWIFKYSHNTQLFLLSLCTANSTREQSFHIAEIFAYLVLCQPVMKIQFHGDDSWLQLYTHQLWVLKHVVLEMNQDKLIQPLLQCKSCMHFWPREYWKKSRRNLHSEYIFLRIWSFDVKKVFSDIYRKKCRTIGIYFMFLLLRALRINSHLRDVWM